MSICVCLYEKGMWSFFYTSITRSKIKKLNCPVESTLVYVQNEANFCKNWSIIFVDFCNSILSYGSLHFVYNKKWRMRELKPGITHANRMLYFWITVVLNWLLHFLSRNRIVSASFFELEIFLISPYFEVCSVHLERF